MERRQHTGVEVEEFGDDHPTSIRRRYIEKLKTRQGFFDRHTHMTILIEYAKWEEESQNNLRRARILWQRALSIYNKDGIVWSQCAKFHLRNRFYSEAKNVLERGVSALPYSDYLWLLYIKMEEKLRGVDAARMIFDRWMDRLPEIGCRVCASFELKHDNVDRARDVYEKLVKRVPDPSSWIFYANFEIDLGQISRARIVYDRAMIVCRDDPTVQNLLNSYAQFEKEIERAKDGVEEDVVMKSSTELEGGSAIVLSPTPASKEEEKERSVVPEARRPIMLKLVKPPYITKISTSV